MDGVAFVFQNEGYYSLGGAGGEIGRNGINSSIAIAFRAYIWDRIEI